MSQRARILEPRVGDESCVTAERGLVVEPRETPPPPEETVGKVTCGSGVSSASRPWAKRQVGLEFFQVPGARSARQEVVHDPPRRTGHQGGWEKGRHPKANTNLNHQHKPTPTPRQPPRTPEPGRKTFCTPLWTREEAKKWLSSLVLFHLFLSSGPQKYTSHAGWCVDTEIGPHPLIAAYHDFLAVVVHQPHP